MLLPRFVHEGKKYATITIGCTGGRHRSVYLVEQLANRLAGRIIAAQAPDEAGFGWRLYVTHRELAREGLETAYLTDRLAPKLVKSRNISVRSAGDAGSGAGGLRQIMIRDHTL